MVKRNYSKELLTRLYKTLCMIRVFETECIQLYRQALIRGYFHPYIGEEAIAVGVCAALREQDYITSTHRGHGHCIARGGDLHLMMAELFGKQTGYCAGRGGSMHIADLQAGNLGANGIVGGGIPIGVGAALGASIRGEDCVAVVFTSDGGVNNGVFGEALNLAAVWNLPLILVVENNQYAVSTPIESVSRDPDLYKRGKALGVESQSVDGNDVLEMYEQTVKAIKRCQKKKGPVLLEAKTYRFGGHHCNDPGKYMPQERLDHYKARDPVLIGKNYLLEDGGATEEEVERIEQEVEQRMRDAIEFGKTSPEPSVDDFLEEVRTY